MSLFRVQIVQHYKQKKIHKDTKALTTHLHATEDQHHEVRNGNLHMEGASLRNDQGKSTLSTPQGRVILDAAVEQSFRSLQENSTDPIIVKNKQAGHDHTTYIPVSFQGPHAPEMNAGKGIDVRVKAGTPLEAQLQEMQRQQQEQKQPPSVLRVSTVKDEKKKWKDTNYAPGVVTQGAIMVVASLVAPGAGTAVAGGVGLTAGTVGYTVTSVVAQAAASHAMTSISTNMIRQKGNLGKALDKTYDSEGMRALGTGVVKAMFVPGIDTQASLGEITLQVTEKATREALIDTAINNEKFTKAFRENLRDNAVNASTEIAATELGKERHTGSLKEPGLTNHLLHKGGHAVIGGVGAALKGRDVASGAAGAVIGESIAEAQVNTQGRGDVRNLTSGQLSAGKAVGQMAAGTFAALSGGEFDTAAAASLNASENNGYDPYSLVLDGLFLTYDAGKAVYAYVADDDEMFKEAGIDIALGTAGMAMPLNVNTARRVGKIGKGIYNAGSKLLKTESKVAKKVVSKTTKAKPDSVLRVNSKKVHGNSLQSKKETHVYRIKDIRNNRTYKIGESAQGLRLRDGQSKRAEAQARKLRKETGEHYFTEVRKNLKDKKSAREYESQLIKRFRKMYGDDKLPGNKNNR